MFEYVPSGQPRNVANRVPDVINYAWREYGMRVGLWRIADVLAAVELTPDLLLKTMTY